LNPILNVDQQLFQGLIIHLKPAVHRLKYGLPIRNHLLKEIQHEYPYIFQVAENTGKILETYFGKPVPDEEIGYLAMHFAAAMEDIR
jgi:transcriptional antiterminator